MLVLSSVSVGIERAMEVLRGGGSALDAVEAGIREVEANPEDHSVGYAGYPNILGEVELDACIMDGRTLAAGAVGGLKRCSHPISVARKVMEELPHVLLVGEGADRFAREMGFPKENLLPPGVKSAWREKLLKYISEGEIKRLRRKREIRHWVRMTADPQAPRETVNFIAIDGRGNIASGVSTSGWAWKYPGRVGDSPIVGAGNYADNRFGAATCTGRGEMAIRAGTARSVILYVKMGMTVQEACCEAMRDLARLEDPYAGWVDIIAVNAKGEFFGTTWKDERYIFYMTDSMMSPERRLKTKVPLEGRD
ncbi:MAG: N(4)-(beta-N-acetylglucosaminyl)-L-asparaginase [bacterium]